MSETPVLQTAMSETIDDHMSTTEQHSAPAKKPRKPRAKSSPVHPDMVFLDVITVAARLGTTVKQIYNMKARAEIVAPVNIPGIGMRWVERAFMEWLRSVIESAPEPRPVKAPRPGMAARARAVAEAATAA